MAKTITSLEPLTVFAKSYILDVLQGSEYTSAFCSVFFSKSIATLCLTKVVQCRQCNGFIISYSEISKDLVYLSFILSSSKNGKVNGETILFEVSELKQ